MPNFSFPTQNSPSVIASKRQTILSTLVEMDPGFAKTPVKSIYRATLQKMYDLYDDLFFNGTLRRYYIRMDVTMSSRLLKSAGKFLHYQTGLRARTAEIRMSSDFLFRLGEGPFELNGLRVATPQLAFMIVFEHELCHAIENAFYGNTGHSDRFMYFAYGVFGHTKSTHDLPTRSSETTEKTGITVGSMVSFPYEGRMITGTVSYLGKTARVMVPSPNGTYYERDNPNHRYMKYQVPISLLTLVN